MAELALDSGGKFILNADGGGRVAVAVEGGSIIVVVGCIEGEDFVEGDDVRELPSPCGGCGGEGSLWVVSADIDADGSARGEEGSVSERTSAVLGRSEREVGALEPRASKSGGSS